MIIRLLYMKSKSNFRRFSIYPVSDDRIFTFRYFSSVASIQKASIQPGSQTVLHEAAISIASGHRRAVLCTRIYIYLSIYLYRSIFRFMRIGNACLSYGCVYSSGSILVVCKSPTISRHSTLGCFFEQ